MKQFDMMRKKNIHFVGIGGCGMSAIAKILHEMGFKVCGSDVKESSNTIRLKDMGIEIFYDHKDSNVRIADLIVYSSAISKNNPELIEAESRSIQIIQRAELLSWIMKQSETSISVAGTHGKTTTTSMISLLFEKCGLDPTYLIGGERNDVSNNAKLGDGRFVIAEADESDGSFLNLDSKISIITNIEADHLDHYNSIENIISAFENFADKIPAGGTLIICSDQENNRLLMKKTKKDKGIISYGFGSDAQIRAVDLKYNGMTSNFSVIKKGSKIGTISLSVPGEQNILNSLAAVAAGMLAGQDFNSIAAGLRSFIGTKRRFQIIGEIDGILIVDDYAHHPTEIKATLDAADYGWSGKKRIIAVFQPHRYSRTLHLKDDFEGAFDKADTVVITDVYSAGEAPISGITGKSIADVAQKGAKNLVYIPRKEKIAEYLMSILKANDILLTLGAGDIFTVGKEVLARIKERKPQK